MLNLFEGRGLEATLHFMEEKVRAGLWSWNLHSAEMQWSAGHYALFGLEPGSVTMTYDRQLALVHPEDRRRLDELESVLTEGLPFTREYRVIQPTGRMRWLATRGEALLNSYGKAYRAVGLSIDITDQHEAQQGAVRDARFRSIMGGIAPLVWATKADGTMADLLGSYEPTGSQAVEVGEHGWLDAVHPEERLATLDEWKRAVETHDLFQIEHRLRVRNGSYRPFHTIGAPHRDADGVFLGWRGVCIDLTARKGRHDVDPDHHAITGAQVRAARGILKWSVSDLAVSANVSPAIIRRIEDFDGAPSRTDGSPELLRGALISGGVEFLFPSDGRPAVRPAASRSELHRPARAAKNLQGASETGNGGLPH